MGSRTNVDFNEIGIQIWYKGGDPPVICHPERSEGMTAVLQFTPMVTMADRPYYITNGTACEARP